MRECGAPPIPPLHTSSKGVWAAGGGGGAAGVASKRVGWRVSEPTREGAASPGAAGAPARNRLCPGGGTVAADGCGGAAAASRRGQPPPADGSVTAAVAVGGATSCEHGVEAAKRPPPASSPDRGSWGVPSQGGAHSTAPVRPAAGRTGASSGGGHDEGGSGRGFLSPPPVRHGVGWRRRGRGGGGRGAVGEGRVPAPRPRERISQECACGGGGGGRSQGSEAR